MTRAEFIAQIAPYAEKDMAKTGVLASITIAQACLESANGSSAPGNNLFGIKGSGTTQATQEFINGEWVTIQAGFRAYEDWGGSITDHSAFLTENGRYTRSGFFDRCGERDYAGAARALQSAGYATDPNYAAKLIAIIEGSGLNKYDEEDDENMPMKLEQWQWDMVYEVFGKAYNEDKIAWGWMQKIVDKTMTATELAFVNTVLDGRIDRKLDV
ncbi:glycoside hydrolase family 73 protein [Paenibacillus sp. SI8]|uniref:glycoside hydrolase family 73 protein n=1 Tax=unclassified Paenibacillus TaxID=185978 RepID=UPI003467EA62